MTTNAVAGPEPSFPPFTACVATASRVVGGERQGITAVTLLISFLVKRSKWLLTIEHPFPEDSDIAPFAGVYSKGQLVHLLRFPLPEALSKGGSRSMRAYFISKFLDLVSSLYLFLKAKRPVDVFVGVEGIHTLAGLILRKLGIVKTVVYLAVDFWPNRFPFPPANAIFLRLDRYCLEHVDSVWNIDETIEELRNRLWRQKFVVPQLYVPAHSPPPNQSFFKRRSERGIVYLGGLYEFFGVQIVLAAMPEVLAKVPEAEFHIIGDGSYKNDLEEMSRSLGLGSNVVFHGFLRDREVIEVLKRCRVGVAPYLGSGPHPPYRFFFSSKLKYYASYGVPTVLSEVVPLSREMMKKYGAGIAARPTRESFADAIIKLNTRDEIYGKCVQGCFDLSESFNSERIYATALQEVFEKTNAHPPQTRVEQ